jgi:hypothetical protein
LTANWPEILGGEGGPVAIDPITLTNWYVNNGAGVSIYLDSPPTGSTPGAFNPVLNYTTSPSANVVKDGYTMIAPAPFLVDPLTSSQLLIATCRVWRGPASGVGWSDANAISPILDGGGSSYCSGDALIRSIAALPVAVSAALPSGGEVVYAGMFGSANGGATLPGHLLTATYNTATGSWSSWTDATLGPVANDTLAMNYYGLDISSIFIDPHDATGKTVYVTIAGFHNQLENVQAVYGSTDGGAHWTGLTANLPLAPANSLVVDPQDANTVYVATDAGVFSTRQIANCAVATSGCWSAFASGLPASPVVQISAAPASATVLDLVAATYGRGIWITPLWTATEDITTATATPGSLTFASQVYGGSSSAQTVTVRNTGTIALTPSYVNASGDFSGTDNCAGSIVQPGQSCTIQVTFTPTQVGSRTGVLTVFTNVTGGELTVSLSGTGASSGVFTLTPASVSFGSWEVGTTSTVLQVTANNSGSPALPYTSAITGAFSIASNACGSSVPAVTACNLTVTFSPVQTGAATGALTFTDAFGTQTVTLSGTGLAPPTDALSLTTLTFPGSIVGQLSTAQTVTLTNSGGVSLTSIAVSVSGAFLQTNACTAILPANSSCAISVQFDPTVVGSQAGTLTVSDATRTQPQTVALSGLGIAPPAFGVSPSSLSFAAQPLNQASAPQTLTVRNTGGAPLADVGFQITGLSAGSFSTGSTTCGTTLANGGSCTVQVVFTPIASGGSTASLAISSSTSGVTAATVPLTGTSQNPAGLNVNPAQLLFPIVSSGQSSLPQTVILTNSGGSTANSLTLTITPPFSLVQVAQNNCGASLASGASCSIGVIFSPSLNGLFTGTLTIASSLAASASVPLSGTGGVPGSVLFQPSVLSFQQTGVGLLSGSSTVTITNPDSVISLGSLTLKVTAGFQLVSSTCPATLAPGASCTAVVAFAPVSAGAQNGSLNVASSALPAGSVLALSGMGFDFTLASSGSATQTISSGQIAYYTLLINPLNGSQGVFTFQCGTLPSSTSCAFNPTSETVVANTTGNEAVEIATGITQTTGRSSRPLAWPVLPLACGLVLLPFALARRRRALLLIALLAILTGGVSSCSHSSGGSSTVTTTTGTGITTPATYSIPVTATSNGVSHQITLTLIVD